MLTAGQFFGDGRRSSMTAFNAACAMIAFGLPGLWYAVFGRLTLRPEPELDDYSDEWSDFEEMETERRG